MTSEAIAAADPPPTSPTPGRSPSHHREEFVCPDCAKRFTRNVRRGLYSRCPRCGGTAVGRLVLEKIASGKVTVNGHRRRSSSSEPSPRSTAVGSFGAKPARRQEAGPVPGLSPPGPAPPARPSFLDRLFGAPGSASEDDEL